MGYNTVVTILNDRLDELEKPGFGRNLRQHIQAWDRHEPTRKMLQGRLLYLGAAEVISVHHADNLAIIAAGANTGRVIGNGYWTQTDDEVIEYLYKDLQRRRRREAKRKTEANIANI